MLGVGRLKSSCSESAVAGAQMIDASCGTSRPPSVFKMLQSSARRVVSAMFARTVSARCPRHWYMSLGAQLCETSVSVQIPAKLPARWPGLCEK